ncbi:MAG: hypothetical protein ABMB14_30345 [Myxococcota bacterium]
MAIVDGLDDAGLTDLQVRFSERAAHASGADGRWIWTGNCLQARYCLGEDLRSSLLDHAAAGFEWLTTCGPHRRPFVLQELWRIVWQIDDGALRVRAAEETDRTDALWESKVYADFVLRGSRPSGPPPVKDLGAALVLPPEEAVAHVAEKGHQAVEAALRASDPGRAVSALGPFAWRRGVVWARRASDGVELVPPGLERLFYGP